MPFDTKNVACAQPGPWPGNDFPQVRDALVRAYQPVGDEEMLLVHQIATTWLRLHRYYGLEAELMREQRVTEMFEKDLERFKALNRTIVSAERMWRDAVREFNAARRRRLAPDSNAAARRRSTAAAAPEPVSQPSPCDAPALAALPHVDNATVLVERDRRERPAVISLPARRAPEPAPAAGNSRDTACTGDKRRSGNLYP
jgi:hypothetical protein